jgi:hypothetical protein
MKSPRSIIYKWQGEEKFVPVHFISSNSGEVAGKLYVLSQKSVSLSLAACISQYLDFI